MKFSKVILGTISILLFAMVFATASFAKAKDRDGEIIAYMEVINNAEISAAKLAKEKKVDDAVMNFADLMIKQHSENLQMITDLSSKINIAADDTAGVNKFKVIQDKELKKLSKLNGAKFQKAYIHAMINGHSGAKKMLGKFEKEAKNSDLHQYLVDTKKVVEQHLAAAKKLK
ncbi:MAG: DUF4142 domain-containing protein [Gammaproteobacteria bacterium]